MSLNTELMQQVVAHLNENKEFKQKSEKLTKYNKQRDIISKVEMPFVGGFIGGAGIACVSAMSSFTPYSENDMKILMGGIGLIGASTVATAIYEELKEHIKQKSVGLYNEIYSQVGDNYIEEMNKTNPNYYEEEFLDDIDEYQQENEKMFDIADFESESIK